MIFYQITKLFDKMTSKTVQNTQIDTLINESVKLTESQPFPIQQLQKLFIDLEKLNTSGTCSDVMNRPNSKEELSNFDNEMTKKLPKMKGIVTSAMFEIHINSHNISLN